METIKKLLEKYKEVISYLFFGVLTTAVNYLAYLLVAPLFNTAMIPTAIAWAASVAFAYTTNRRFVFHSKAKGRELAVEAGKFVAARVLSGIADVAFMWVFADMLHFNDKLMKLLSNIFVVIFNYVASKLVVFKKSNYKTVI